MESLFIQLLGDVYISIKKTDPYDWFCSPMTGSQTYSIASGKHVL